MVILIGCVCGCPISRNDYWPCQCNINKTKVGNSIHLDCSSRNLTNSRAGEILQVFLSDQKTIQQLEEINLSYNQLTKVPFEIRFFHQTWLIDLSHNKIHSVPSGAFNYSATQRQPVKIALDSNKITSIEAKAFQGTLGLGSSLCLMDNRLTRFETNVFKPFLEQVIVNYNTTTSDFGFVDIFMSNKNLKPSTYLKT